MSFNPGSGKKHWHVRNPNLPGASAAFMTEEAALRYNRVLRSEGSRDTAVMPCYDRDCTDVTDAIEIDEEPDQDPHRPVQRYKVHFDYGGLPYCGIEPIGAFLAMRKRDVNCRLCLRAITRRANEIDDDLHGMVKIKRGLAI